LSGIVAVTNGGTGASTAANALIALGAYSSANPTGYQTAANLPLNIVASVASLRLKTTVTLAVNCVYLSGYATVCDGGEGLFFYISTDITTADNGGTVLVDASSRRWYRAAVQDSVSVMQFGAVGNGTTNDTFAFNSAMTWMNGKGGGTVTFPVKAFLIDPITIPAAVTLQGSLQGPFDAGVNPATRVTAPTLLVNSTAGSFVTLAGYAASVTDCLIFYPSQVAPTAITPTAYPPTILATGAGNAIARVTLVNSYIGIFLAVGRVSIFDCKIGSYLMAIHVDNAEDYVFIDRIEIEPLYNIYLGLATPQTIDTWVLNHSQGIVVSRADAISVSNVGIFVKYAAIVLNDTATAGVSPKNGYGKFVNIDCDTVAYGVDASSSNNVGGGYQFTNLGVGGNPTGVGTAAQAAIVMTSGGSSPPTVLWNGGAQRSNGGWAAGQTCVVFSTGNCKVTGVYGINDVGLLTATPAMPAANVAMTNPFPFKVRVFIQIPSTSTTVSTIALDDHSIWVTTPGMNSAPFNLLLNGGETLSLNYVGSPTWQWFATN
jgi:hypothetical protein